MRHDVARRVQFGTALVHSKYGITASQWICRALARDAGKANSYQLGMTPIRPRNPVPPARWIVRFNRSARCDEKRIDSDAVRWSLGRIGDCAVNVAVARANAWSDGSMS